MRVIREMLSDIESKTFDIGFVGEKNHTCVMINCVSLFKQYPDAVATMVARPPVGDIYPVILNRDGVFVVWNVSESDIANAGSGQYQLTFTDGEGDNAEIIKTVYGSFSVKPSMVSNGEAPDPIEDWLEEANEALAEFGKINELSASATTIAPGQPATAEITTVSGHKNIVIGVPKGDKGDKGDNGDPAPAEEVTAAVDAYLAENFSNPSNPPLDRSLSSSSSAAPADLVGNLKSALNNMAGYEISALNLGSWTPNSFVETNGAISPFGGWHRTDYIEIGKNDGFIYFRNSGNTSEPYNHFYDASKNPTGSNFNTNSTKIAIPDDAKYFIVSCEDTVTVSANKSPIDITTLAKKTYVDTEVNDASSAIVQELVGFNPIVDMGTWIPNSFVETNGAISSFGGWHRTDYIEIGANDGIIHFTNSGNTSEPYNHFYDASKNPIDSNFNTNNVEITIPDGAKYFIVSCEDTITVNAEKIIEPLADKASKGSIAKDVLSFNFAVEPFVIQSTSARCPEFNDTIDPLTFVHFSDVHTNRKAWENVCEYMDNYKDLISFGLHTGDYCGNYQGSYVDLYALRTPTNPILNCVGNHDVYATPNGIWGTRESVYNLLFNHTTGWDVTFENISYPTNYYKDFANHKIRLVVMDYYFTDATDMEWFAGVLNGAKALGYSVITAMHEVSKPIVEKLDCTFQTLDDYESLGGNSSVHALDGAIKSFKDNGGSHICNLVGHEHADMIGYTDGGVLNIVIECATNNTTWTDAKRIANTKTFDCFNVFSVDVQNHVLKIVRVGNNSDHYLRAKNILCYDYVNQRILSNA